MKNYYDELEVSKKASKEVIEKVYRVLAKKYHPDTSKELDKQASEDKFKSISEAYETLSNAEKRKKYDIELEKSNPTISYEDYINVVKQRDALNNALNKFKNSPTNNQYNNIKHNKMNFDNNTNHSNATNKSNNANYTKQNHTTSSYTQQNKTYYNNTKKIAYLFDYFKYKIKELFTNISILLFSILVAMLIFNAFSDFNLFSLFIK